MALTVEQQKKEKADEIARTKEVLSRAIQTSKSMRRLSEHEDWKLLVGIIQQELDKRRMDKFSLCDTALISSFDIEGTVKVANMIRAVHYDISAYEFILSLPEKWIKAGEAAEAELKKIEGGN
ncbi:MAG: hypothetical protein AAB875_07170 [Patescibacteria group bacterium]